MLKGQPRTVLLRYFAGLTEHAFCSRLGVADPPMIDYLSDMLVRFIRSDVIFRVRDISGHSLTEVAEMLVEAEARLGAARREVHRHIGDFILFCAGVYPEALQRMQRTESKDHLLNDCAQGKRAYYIASRITVDEDREEEAPSAVLERLSEQFELCMYGLGEVRREWESRDSDDGPQTFLIN